MTNGYNCVAFMVLLESRPITEGRQLELACRLVAMLLLLAAPNIKNSLAARYRAVNVQRLLTTGRKRQRKSPEYEHICS